MCNSTRAADAAGDSRQQAASQLLPHSLCTLYLHIMTYSYWVTFDHIKGSHSFGLVIPDCELYWTHVQISTQAIEKASMEWSIQVYRGAGSFRCNHGHVWINKGQSRRMICLTYVVQYTCIMHAINEYFVSNKLVMYLFMSLFMHINCVNIIEGVGLECQAVCNVLVTHTICSKHKFGMASFDLIHCRCMRLFDTVNKLAAKLILQK